MKAKLKSKKVEFVTWNDTNASKEEAVKTLTEFGAKDIKEMTSNIGRNIHFSVPFNGKEAGFVLGFNSFMVLEKGKLPKYISKKEFDELYDIIEE